MQSPEESQLVQRAQSGDREALGQLLLQAYEDLARFLSRRIPPPMQRHLGVDDVIQQVYAKAFQEVMTFEYRGDGSFQAWLRSIASFRLQDAIREMQRKKRGGDFHRIESPAAATNSANDVLAMIAGSDPTASRLMRHREAEQAMRLAIAELPEDYREVIQHRYFEMRSIQETADRMGRTEAAVRSLTDRAKKELREALSRISLYLSSRG